VEAEPGREHWMQQHLRGVRMGYRRGVRAGVALSILVYFVVRALIWIAR
jgi:hypothetical protein